MGLAACGDLGDWGFFTGDDEGVDGPRNEANRALILWQLGGAGSHLIFLCVLMSSSKENFLRSEAELKLDLVSQP